MSSRDNSISELESKLHPDSVSLARLVAAYVYDEICSDTRKPIRQEWLTTEQVAQLTGRTVRALERQRKLGGGPPFSKNGNIIRYRVTDVDAWMESGRNDG